MIDPTLFNRVVQTSLPLQQPTQRPLTQQQQQQRQISPSQLQQQQQSKISSSASTTVSPLSGVSSTAAKTLLNQATLANALKLHNLSAATQGLSTQQQQQQQGLTSVTGLVAQQGLTSQASGTLTPGAITSGAAAALNQGLTPAMVTQMGLTSANAALLPKAGGTTKIKSRRNQTKHVPEESLPFPCDVCGRRFVSMHSVCELGGGDVNVTVALRYVMDDVETWWR